jgi:CRP-like cAMP-binding protein
MSLDAAIAKCPIFEGVAPKRARALLDGATRHTLRAGEILIDEGVPNEELHLVVSGHLRVMLPANDTRPHPVHLAELGVGAITGEYSAFDKRAASARVSAVEDTDLLTLRATDFVTALDQDPDAAKHVYRNLLELLIERLRAQDAEVELIAPVARGLASRH